MLTKTITFISTALINAGIGTMMFFMLILSLNGFTGKQAEPGIYLFIAWTVLTAIISGVLSFLSAGYLINNKSFHPALAAFAAIAIFALLGAASDFIGFLAAIFLTSAMR
jgi:hypothetical protein